MTETKIIDRIRKLLELASNEGATEAEAANALEKANALMMKHGIDQAMFEKENGEVEIGYGNPFTDYKRRWHKTCASAASHLYGCSYAIFGSTEFRFFGRSEIVGAAELTFLHLAAQIEAWYKLDLPKGLTKMERAKWRHDFKEACALRVYHRVVAIVKDLQENDQKAQEAVGHNALVVLDHRTQLKSELDDFMDARKMKKNRSRALSLRYSEASARGMEAGNKVKINQELKR